MILHCPKCGMQHIDGAEPGRAVWGNNFESPIVEVGGWENPPHRSHLCHRCGHIWRPADVPTNGVAAIKTQGKADSPIARPDQSARIKELEEALRQIRGVASPSLAAQYPKGAAAKILTITGKALNMPERGE
jgi:hypothetical protein